MVVRRMAWCLVGVVLLVLSSSVAFGQGRGGFPGGGFPGGGFGGGMGGDPVSLLRIEEVRKHLELLDDQVASLEKLREGARQDFRRPDGNFRDLSEEERRKRFTEMQQEMEKRNKEMLAKVEEILLPHQMDRLKQLSIQRRGLTALRDPEVAATLKITDDQKKQLEAVGERAREKMQGLFQPGGGNPRDLSEEERRKRFEEMREKGAVVAKEVETETLAVLTDAQKKQFEEMKGEPFTFPPVDFGNFGRRGGGPGGQGGRRNNE